MQLPEVRGRITQDADLSKTNWFQVGGKADVLFKPKDLEDLQHFLKNKPDCPITVLGVGSNIIIRDGGIEGVVIKLGRTFSGMTHRSVEVECGGATLDVHLASYSAQQGISGLEFLSGIPGTIGGAVAMNGGAYGRETQDVLTKAQMVDMEGNLHEFRNEELGFDYRTCAKLQEQPYIVTKAWFLGRKGDSTEISEKIDKIKAEREESQPIRSNTGGSTFKNPPDMKAWELIDKAGLRGFSIGDAQISEKHCNFLINKGKATAKDLENLINHIKKAVFEDSGVNLESEIRIIGRDN